MKMLLKLKKNSEKKIEQYIRVIFSSLESSIAIETISVTPDVDGTIITVDYKLQEKCLQDPQMITKSITDIIALNTDLTLLSVDSSPSITVEKSELELIKDEEGIKMYSVNPAFAKKLLDDPELCQRYSLYSELVNPYRILAIILLENPGLGKDIRSISTTESFQLDVYPSGNCNFAITEPNYKVKLGVFLKTTDSSGNKTYIVNPNFAKSLRDNSRLLHDVLSSNASEVRLTYSKNIKGLVFTGKIQFTSGTKSDALNPYYCLAQKIKNDPDFFSQLKTLDSKTVLSLTISSDGIVTTNFDSVSTSSHSEEKTTYPIISVPKPAPVIGVQSSSLAPIQPIQVTSLESNLMNSLQPFIEVMLIKGEKIQFFLESLSKKNHVQALRRICTSSAPEAFEIIKLLCEYQKMLSFDINAQAEKDGKAAIHYAACNPNKEIYPFLVTQGANPALIDGSGKSAESQWLTHHSDVVTTTKLISETQQPAKPIESLNGTASLSDVTSKSSNHDSSARQKTTVPNDTPIARTTMPQVSILRPANAIPLQLHSTTPPSQTQRPIPIAFPPSHFAPRFISPNTYAFPATFVPLTPQGVPVQRKPVSGATTVPPIVMPISKKADPKSSCSIPVEKAPSNTISQPEIASAKPTSSASLSVPIISDVVQTSPLFDLPDELLLKILFFVNNASDFGSLLRVCKKLKELIDNDLFWNHFLLPQFNGGRNFIKTLVGILPISSKAKSEKFFLKLPIERIRSVKRDEVLKILREENIISEEVFKWLKDVKSHTDVQLSNYLLTKYGLMALHEGLITLPDILLFWRASEKLSSLFTVNGLIALSEKLIALEEAVAVNINTLGALLSSNGLRALREKLITVSQASRYNNSLGLMLSNDGLIIALREKLITLEEAATNINILGSLLSPNGLIALREKLINISQASKYPAILGLIFSNDAFIGPLCEKLITFEETVNIGKAGLQLLLSPNGQIALKEDLITSVQVSRYYRSDSNHRDNPNLCYLITDNGLIALREKLFTPEEVANISILGLVLSNDVFFIPLRAKLISLEEMVNFGEQGLRSLLSPNGQVALKEGLITLKQVFQYYRSDSPYFCHPKLSCLISDNGLIALREKLITPEEAANISDLKSLLSSHGLVALREGLITPVQASIHQHSGLAQGPHANLRYLITENGLAALRENLITPEEAAYINELGYLLSPNGITALREGLITSLQATKIYRSGCIEGPKVNLSDLLTGNGLIALRRKLITPEEASMISNLSALLSDHGLVALTEGFITVKQIFQHGNDICNPYYLNHLLTPNGLIALCEKLITPEEAAIFGSNLETLLSNDGLTALQDKLITLDEAKKIKDLKFLLSSHGLIALRERLITPSQAAEIYHSGAFDGPRGNLCHLLSPNGLIALREKLITHKEAVFDHDLRGKLSDSGLEMLRRRKEAELLSSPTNPPHVAIPPTIATLSCAPPEVSTQPASLSSSLILVPLPDAANKSTCSIPLTSSLLMEDPSSIVLKKGEIELIEDDEGIKTYSINSLFARKILHNPNLRQQYLLNSQSLDPYGILVRALTQDIIFAKSIKRISSTDRLIMCVYPEERRVIEISLEHNIKEMLGVVLKTFHKSLAGQEPRVVFLSDAFQIEIASQQQTRSLSVRETYQASLLAYLSSKLKQLESEMEVFKSNPLHIFQGQLEAVLCGEISILHNLLHEYPSSPLFPTIIVGVSEEFLNLVSENIISFDEIHAITYNPFRKNKTDYLSLLCTKHGISALRERLLTLEEASRIQHLSELLSEDGLTALSLKLITPSQAALFTRASDLLYLVSPNGRIALREELITPEEAARDHNLKMKLSDSGLAALRKTKEEAFLSSPVNPLAAAIPATIKTLSSTTSEFSAESTSPDSSPVLISLPDEMKKRTCSIPLTSSLFAEKQVVPLSNVSASETMPICSLPLIVTAIPENTKVLTASTSEIAIIEVLKPTDLELPVENLFPVKAEESAESSEIIDIRKIQHLKYIQNLFSTLMKISQQIYLPTVNKAEDFPQIVSEPISLLENVKDLLTSYSSQLESFSADDALEPQITRLIEVVNTLIQLIDKFFDDIYKNYVEQFKGYDAISKKLQTLISLDITFRKQVEEMIKSVVSPKASESKASLQALVVRNIFSQSSSTERTHSDEQESAQQHSQSEEIFSLRLQS